GVVAIESIVRSDSVMPVVMRQLQWGTAWIELSLRRIEAKKYTPENQQLVSVLTLTALSLEYESFQAAATAVTTELATLLKCERTSIGFIKGHNIQVRALSHSADFSKKSKLIQNIGLAMDESMDQQVSLVYPPNDKNTVYVLRNHEALTHEDDIVNVCTIPFSINNHIYGAMTLERSSDFPFNKKTIELCETIASMIGPVLEGKRKEDRWLITKAWSSLKHFFKNLLGPAHAVLKLVSLLMTAFVIFCFVATGDYRISADTYLEGKIQRVIITPFDGYIDEAYVRAGDVVRKNTPLVTLDDTELLLEKIKLKSQKEQFIKEYRNALGENDRSKVSVLNAQIGQVEAQMKLTNIKLKRAKIEAPFDGVIISGDLSHSLGAPTQRGEILFEIAPLNAYRIILEVDERDISYIRNDQDGELVLAGYSNDIMPFYITKITPVSESKEGRTYFRVEGELKNKHDFLRPGMSGVGKVMIDERKLIWIWTKNLVDWLRLTFWTWWPAGL
ncbi:MAG: HlyD family efflux transporter periplasmic adaptor subunit, partial [Thiotrichaceae bacterium]|nr:HlyD family efflux transporter periplasmic adaptor subunit [Thiotrichaceae bacterium]